MTFLVYLEILHRSVTFATLIARNVPNISDIGMYHLLVPLQSTFSVESFSTCVARMFTNLRMRQKMLGEKGFVGRSFPTDSADEFLLRLLQMNAANVTVES